MEQFDRLITDFSIQKIIFLLENRKNLIYQLLQRRLQTNGLTVASFNKVVTGLKDYDPQKKYHLRIINNHGSIQYYLVPYGGYCGSRKTIYIPRKNEQIAKYMAQIQYNNHLVYTLEKELKYLTKILAVSNKLFSSTQSQLTFTNRDTFLKKAKCALITTAIQSDLDFANEWQATSYKKNSAYPERLIFKTRKEELVRSKSEVIIANELLSSGIPYKYEVPLLLKNGSDAVTIHPDFVLLDVKTRKEIIWEHFGLMDNSEYSVEAVQKIRLYQQNGYFPGKNLIITMETRECPLTNSIVRQTISNI